MKPKKTTSSAATAFVAAGAAGQAGSIAPLASPQPGMAMGKRPAFQTIKSFVLDKIHSGEWREGDLIPSEEALAQTFGVSRMTVNRALRELSAELSVVRVQGSGTYVAQQKYQATVIEIRNIADEIAARGHSHRAELQLLERCRASPALAAQFHLPEQAPLFHSVVVHFEDEQPIQVEDRYVNPLVAPDYLTCDFGTQTPNAYLMRVAPLRGVAFIVEACLASDDILDMLAMEPREPCLVLRRTTLTGEQVASVATLWHPASRYRFAGAF